MCKLHSCLTQNEDKTSVFTSNIFNTVGQFTVPTSECCDSCITQEGALVFSLYTILQKYVLQNGALQKDTTNKATLTSLGMMRQENNPKSPAETIPSIKPGGKRSQRQNQDSQNQ